uniref:Serine/threonine-protein kinase 2 n=1 Tax=Megaviridae environmental sample TaxID=1737588 RepID=A0A5J6VH75_9VIRU|nr:MAG: serine/threonine protein kinase [Megaviridae environmental sample]
MRSTSSITSRLEFITQLLDGNVVVNILEIQDKELDERHCKDIRYVLDKKTWDMNTVIKKMNSKLLYVKSGSTGHTFRGIPQNNIGSSFALKVVAFPRREVYGSMNNVKRPENAEILMLKILSEFVISKQTPHIILPIATFYTSIKSFVHSNMSDVVDNELYKKFVHKYKKSNGKEYYERVSILLSEWASKGDLLDLLRKNYASFTVEHWRAVFFQVLSVLAIIHAKYPDFRHNDLKPNNVLVDSVDKSRKSISYIINEQKYVVPNAGFILKLWDFDFACIPGVVDNSKVSAQWCNDVNIFPERNQYYDVHYFFNTLIHFVPKAFKSGTVDPTLKSFILRIIPPSMTRGEDIVKKRRLLLKTEYTTPDKILRNDEFFAPYRR